MTDNTQELDEILHFFEQHIRNHSRLTKQPELSHDEAKQAILELIDRKVKEVLSERQKSKS